uniref:Uncharacterized protein n=1 Tax=Rhizophora mucronata TaxID=61149 RepID=A0A2P2QD16_RHIMU
MTTITQQQITKTNKTNCCAQNSSDCLERNMIIMSHY